MLDVMELDGEAVRRREERMLEKETSRKREVRILIMVDVVD